MQSSRETRNQRLTSLVFFGLSCCFVGHGTAAWFASRTFGSEWYNWVHDTLPFLGYVGAALLLKFISVLDYSVAIFIWPKRTRRYFLYWAIAWTSLTMTYRIWAYYGAQAFHNLEAFGEFFKRAPNVCLAVSAAILGGYLVTNKIRRMGAASCALRVLKLGVLGWFLGALLTELKIIFSPEHWDVVYRNLGWLTRPTATVHVYIFAFFMLYFASDLWLANYFSNKGEGHGRIRLGMCSLALIFILYRIALNFLLWRHSSAVYVAFHLLEEVALLVALVAIVTERTPGRRELRRPCFPD